MILLLKQTLDSLQDHYDNEGFDDDDAYDTALVEQGYNAEEIEVEDGETFTIPEGMEADVMDEEDFYLEDEDNLLYTLSEGRYCLEGNIVKSV